MGMTPEPLAIPDAASDHELVAASLGGGGHPNAAGLILPGGLSEAKARVLGAIRAALTARR